MSSVKKGRKIKLDPLRVAGWRQSKGASIAATAGHFGISRRTVTNYCRDYGEAAKQARNDWRFNRRVDEYEKGIAEGDRDLAVLMAQTDVLRGD